MKSSLLTAARSLVAICIVSAVGSSASIASRTIMAQEGPALIDPQAEQPALPEPALSPPSGADSADDPPAEPAAEDDLDGEIISEPADSSETADSDREELPPAGADSEGDLGDDLPDGAPSAGPPPSPEMEEIDDELDDAAQEAAPRRRSTATADTVLVHFIDDLDLSVTETAGRLEVSRVVPDGVGEDAGFRRGDEIVSFDGVEVSAAKQLSRLAGRADRAEVIVFRGDGEQTLDVEIAAPAVRRPDPAVSASAPPSQPRPRLGVVLDERYETVAVIREVHPRSAAERAGLRPGDAIVGINGRRVSGPDHLIELVAGMPMARELDIEYSRPIRRSVRVSPQMERGTAYGVYRLPLDGSRRPLPATGQSQFNRSGATQNGVVIQGYPQPDDVQFRQRRPGLFRGLFRRR